MRRVVPLVLAAFLLGCGGPFVMLPGGELSGEVKPPPADWSFSDAVDDVQLETLPENPYSVNVWGVGIGPDFFVAAAVPDATLAQNLALDDRVRLRVGEDVYELRAIRDDTDEARAAFLKAAARKYAFEPDPEETAQAVLFRLVPR